MPGFHVRTTTLVAQPRRAYVQHSAGDYRWDRESEAARAAAARCIARAATQKTKAANESAAERERRWYRRGESSEAAPVDGPGLARRRARKSEKKLARKRAKEAKQRKKRWYHGTATQAPDGKERAERNSAKHFSEAGAEAALEKRRSADDGKRKAAELELLQAKALRALRASQRPEEVLLDCRRAFVLGDGAFRNGFVQVAGAERVGAPRRLFAASCEPVY